MRLTNLHYIAETQIDVICNLIKQGKIQMALDEIKTIKNNQVIGTRDDLRKLLIDVSKLRIK